jgi:hypothetical protein
VGLRASTKIRGAALLGALAFSCGGKGAAGDRPLEPAVVVAPIAPVASQADASIANPIVIATEEADAGPPLRALSDFEREIADVINGWQKQSQCSDYDYFPEGGYSNFWCHRPQSIGEKTLEARSGVNIFVSGPHSRGFTSTSANDFGRYNPDFVKWLADKVAPDGRNTVFRASTQAAYDANMRPLAEVFFWTLAKIRRDRACFDRETSLYAMQVKRKGLPRGYYERWFFFMNPFFCERSKQGLRGDEFYYDNGFDAGVDGNVTKTAVGFFVRRAMDDTIADFGRALDKLIAAYEPQLPSTMRLPDGAQMTAALDAAVREAASCPDGSGRRSSLNVSFTADGRAARHRPKQGAGTEDTCLDEKLAHVRVAPFDGPPIRFRRSLPRK